MVLISAGWFSHALGHMIGRDNESDGLNKVFDARFPDLIGLPERRKIHLIMGIVYGYSE
jgi:hypothetical protein